MAWYAYVKWKMSFSKRPLTVNMIHWYREKRFNEWYNSLSEEDRLAYDERQLEKKKRSKQESRRMAQTLLMTSGLVHAIAAVQNTHRSSASFMDGGW